MNQINIKVDVPERKMKNHEEIEAWNNLQKYEQRNLLCDMFDLSHVATNEQIITTINDWLK